MVIFIDESGTHKQSGHAANAVVYITLDDIEEVESQLRQIVADMDLESFHLKILMQKMLRNGLKDLRKRKNSVPRLYFS